MLIARTYVVGAAVCSAIVMGGWFLCAHAAEAAAAQANQAGSNQDLVMGLLSRYAGEWTVKATWSDGKPLKGREVHELGLAGKVLKSQTFVVDDQGIEYQRYEMVTWWDAKEQKARYKSWVFDGSTEEGEIVAVDGQTLEYPAGVDEHGHAKPVRQTVMFARENEIDWTVYAKRSDGSEDVLIRATWKKR